MPAEYLAHMGHKYGMLNELRSSNWRYLLMLLTVSLATTHPLNGRQRSIGVIKSQQL